MPYQSAMTPFRPIQVGHPRGAPSALVAPILALAALGAVLVIPLVLLAAIPLLFAVALAIGGVIACGLGLWALVEGLAAFERWLETDPRFHQ